MKKKICSLLLVACVLGGSMSVFAASATKSGSTGGGTCNAGASYTNKVASGTTTFSKAGATTEVVVRANVYTGSYGYRYATAVGTYGASAVYNAESGEAIDGVYTTHKVTYYGSTWSEYIALGNWYHN